MVLHGVRADPQPLGTGAGRPPHVAAGLGKVQLSQELPACCAAAVTAELPSAKLAWVALPSPLQELRFRVRVAYLIFDKPALQ